MAAGLVVALAPACLRAADQAPPQVKVAADTTWSKDVTVESDVRVENSTLTVAPGVTVTFKGGGRITVASGAALVAKGAEGKPVKLVGEEAGIIAGWNCKVLLERCEITGMGAEQNKRRQWLSLSAGPGGLELRNCTISECAGTWITLKGPVTISGCDFRRAKNTGELGGIRTYGKGRLLVEGSTFTGMDVGAGAGTSAVVKGNVLIGGTIVGWKNESLVVEGNYVHRSAAKGSYGMRSAVGTIRGNVVRGGSWVTAQIGGEITNNVFISLPHEGVGGPGKFDSSCTHEHICGLRPGSTVARNIFVGASYGGVMGIGSGTCSGSVIRNNTFDMRGRGDPVCLNHLPKGKVKGIVFRSNIFMRGGKVHDEKGVPDSCSYLDHNLWSEVRDGGRYRKMTITGSKPGDAGFGSNDVPPGTGSVPAASVVADPEVKFPFTDDEMLARKHTVAEVLAAYRKAYAPKKGSPALDGGDPADREDPAVTDGRPDIGAVELVKE